MYLRIFRYVVMSITCPPQKSKHPAAMRLHRLAPRCDAGGVLSAEKLLKYEHNDVNMRIEKGHGTCPVFDGARRCFRLAGRTPIHLILNRKAGRKMKIAFIGTGNMGGALAKAASKDRENRIYLVNRHPEKAEALRREIGGEVTDYAQAIREAELVFLGVKPYVLPELCKVLRPLFMEKDTPFAVVSMAAGVPVARLKEMLGDCPIIRIMPNTPVSVGEGMILYTGDAETQVDAFLRAMRYAGRFLRVEERLMDAGMAVSGCGPAFVDLFVEALSDAGVASGLSRKDATLLAAQMVLGSAKLILESGKHPGELKDAVCSPCGTTIQGVRKLEEKGFRSAVIEAVIAARDA